MLWHWNMSVKFKGGVQAGERYSGCQQINGIENPRTGWAWESHRNTHTVLIGQRQEEDSSESLSFLVIGSKVTAESGEVGGDTGVWGGEEARGVGVGVDCGSCGQQRARWGPVVMSLSTDERGAARLVELGEYEFSTGHFDLQGDSGISKRNCPPGSWSCKMGWKSCPSEPPLPRCPGLGKPGSSPAFLLLSQAPCGVVDHTQCPVPVTVVAEAFETKSVLERV